MSHRKDYGQSLMEAIDFRSVEYGTNEETNNGEIMTGSGSQYTFFQDGGNYYAVGVDSNGIFGFAASPEFSTNLRDYSVNRMQSASAFKVFSNVLFVLSELVRKAPQQIHYLKFAAADHKLAGIYDKMVKNDRLVREVRGMGFRYVGVMEEKGKDRFIFSRSFG